jgi:hypothetical protein
MGACACIAHGTQHNAADPECRISCCKRECTHGVNQACFRSAHRDERETKYQVGLVYQVHLHKQQHRTLTA